MNISACAIEEVSATIVNLPNLQTLYLGGNRLHDFSVFDQLAQLRRLNEVNIYDPNYEDNPICGFPNYGVISVAKLPQVQFLDTCRIADRVRAGCQQKAAETKLYYVAKFASEMSAASTNYSKLLKSATALFGKRDAGIAADPAEIGKFYRVLENAELAELQLAEFSRLAATLAFESGGTICLTKIETVFRPHPSIVINSDATVSAAWTVSHLPLTSLAPAEDPKTVKFVRIEKLENAVQLLQNWTSAKSFGELNSVVVDEPISSIIQCFETSKGIYPETVIFFSETPDQSLSKIERICLELKNGDIEPIGSETALVVFQQTFSFVETLQSITLIECGVTSLSIFAGLMELRELRVPFNSIQSLCDLPLLPRLEKLDVSFNSLSEVQSLSIESAAMRSNLREILIFGNPICEPRTLRYLSYLCPNSVNFLRSAARILNLEDLLAVENLTTVDVRRQCLASLSPLSQLPNLRTLFASGNDLRKIDFSSATIEFADFSENSLIEFPRSADFPRLLTLLMNSNRLLSLSEILTVSALFVGDNEIDGLLTQEILPNLEVLFIVGNPCAKTFHDNRFIFSLPKLKMLNGNVINSQHHAKVDKLYGGVLFTEDLPKILQPKQTFLDLSDKELHDVNLLQSDSLTDLNLSSNLITQIEWEPNSLPCLVALDLSNNQLQVLLFLMVLPCLRVLNLSSNDLNDQQFAMICGTRMPSLAKLVLTKNALKRVDLVPNQNFPALEVLDLSRNYISVINSGAFDCKRLQRLNLSYNSLRKLDNLGVASLLSLDVSHNRIPTVDEVDKLRGCVNLEHFWFNDNPLTQRIVPRIRCLCLLGSVTEMDGRQVTESDLSQVRTLLEQNDGMPPMISGKPPKMNTVILQPSLPQLTTGGGSKRKGRFPP